MHTPLVEVTRGRIVESVHCGSIAVVDSAGRLLYSAGDPEAVVFLRSSAKPFQAIPLMESGAVQGYRLSDRDIAIACASHVGSDMHVQAVRALQEKAGIRESDLLCGVHPPADRAIARELIRRGEEPTPYRHNCSGKHSGMLAAIHHRWGALVSPDGLLYTDIRHPFQQEILRAFSEMCSLPVERVEVGVDGCSVPNFAVPLQAAAFAAARLVSPEKLPEVRAQACRSIVSAMTHNPELIRGEGYFDTELMRLGAGRLLSKSGAEGYQLIGISADAFSMGTPAMGIAVKIADGDAEDRACGLASLAVLSQLGWNPPNGVMKRSLPRELTNWRGVTVGSIRACFELVKCV